MKYYRFKTFTTSYFFPEEASKSPFLYGLYSPFGGIPSKAYWWAFINVGLVRKLTSVENPDDFFPYSTIHGIEGGDNVMSFNMGSPGVEQKISILGWDSKKQMPFFSKFSQKDRAKVLTKNEIAIYEKLKGTGLTARLYNSIIKDDYVYLKTEFVEGKRPSSMEVNQQVFDICILLKDYHLSSNNGELVTSLSHGDFCPWNMLVKDNMIKLIDWELADERPLGFDLLTYITQVSLLFSPDNSLVKAIDENTEWIDKYYSKCNVSDIHPYIKAFAKEKAKYEESKGNTDRAKKFKEIID